MNSTELLNEIKNQLELLKHKGYDKNSFKSGYLLGYAKALQLLQTDVSGSTCPKCGCQINDPFTGTAIIHDVQACGGIIR